MVQLDKTTLFQNDYFNDTMLYAEALSGFMLALQRDQLHIIKCCEQNTV